MFQTRQRKPGRLLSKGGGSALDAVEQGVMIEEADVRATSLLGKEVRPDRDGNVTLDACIMDKDSNCGSVVYVFRIYRPSGLCSKKSYGRNPACYA